MFCPKCGYKAKKNVKFCTDGTVIAVGYNLFGQCDVDEWTNIGIPAE